MDTRIEICCAAKPGLLLSTVNTLELLGLEIQQCVISCFNDFSMQASCSDVCMLIRFLHFISKILHSFINHLICSISPFVVLAIQVVEQQAVTGSEDIKQALFRNAGYGGRCL